MSIQLSKELIKSISSSTSVLTSTELSNNQLFHKFYDEYKTVEKKSRGHITKLIGAHLEAEVRSDNIRRTIKGIAKVAYDYLDMQVITKFDRLEYTNINKLVKLFKYLDTHKPEVKDIVRDDIKELYEKGMSGFRYDNKIATKVTELKNKYQLTEVEGEFKVLEFNGMLKTLEKSMNNYTAEEKQRLIVLLSEGA